MLVIPWRQLSGEALRGLIESYINREGTDYGSREYSLEEKVAQVRSQIEHADVIIVYDEDTGSCNLLAKTQLAANGGQSAVDSAD